ncbi:MAG: hypothetical protein V4487_03490 [Chlamydiota bacterium]
MGKIAEKDVFKQSTLMGLCLEFLSYPLASKFVALNKTTSQLQKKAKEKELFYLKKFFPENLIEALKWQYEITKLPLKNSKIIKFYERGVPVLRLFIKGRAITKRDVSSGGAPYTSSEGCYFMSGYGYEARNRFYRRSAFSGSIDVRPNGLAVNPSYSVSVKLETSGLAGLCECGSAETIKYLETKYSEPDRLDLVLKGGSMFELYNPNDRNWRTWIIYGSTMLTVAIATAGVAYSRFGFPFLK